MQAGIWNLEGLEESIAVGNGVGKPMGGRFKIQDSSSWAGSFPFVIRNLKNLKHDDTTPRFENSITKNSNALMNLAKEPNKITPTPTPTR